MIKGKKVKLRPLQIEDAKKTIMWRNDPVIKKMAMMHPFQVTEANEKEWYEQLLKDKNGKRMFFAILDEKNEAIGFVSLNNINKNSRLCTLSIVIGDVASQGKGYGKDTMMTILNYAFTVLDLHKVSLEVIDINTKALQLYKDLGFTEEGRFKKHFFVEGNFHDVINLACFKETFSLH